MFDQVIVDRVKEAINSEKMIFFVGAGISINSGVPNFGELNKRVISAIANRKLSEDEIELLSKHLRPEVVLQRGRDELGEEIVESLGMVSGHKPDYYEPNYNHFFLAEALRHGNWVFTTNFDNLIERACKERKIEFKKCYREDKEKQDFGDFVRENRLNEEPDPKNIKGGYLFKLHGTIEDEKEGLKRFKTIQVALNQVGQGLDKNREKVLKYFLNNCDFCFVGYSDQDDFSVRPILEGIGCKKGVFWFSHAKGEVGEIIWGKERLQEQMENENSKPSEVKDWTTINVNKFLSRSGKPFKIVGHSSEYIKRNLCPLVGISTKREIEKKPVTDYETFEQWAKDINEFGRSVFIGRLFEDVREWDKAEHYYKQAIELAGNKEQLIKAKEKLANVYYRRDERGKEDEAIRVYWECINDYKELGDSFKAACLKVAIANVERRIGGDEKYKRSKDLAEEAEKELKPFYELIKDEVGNEYREQKLEYARCLNVLGLAYLAGPERNNTKGLELCEDSRKIKEKEGDMDGVAESENAIGLHFTGIGRNLSNQGQKLVAKEKLEDAIKHLEEAIDIRVRYVFFRGCAQPCRNIGDAYKELVKIEVGEKEKKRLFQKAEKSYKEGISFWKLIKPRYPIGEVLHFSQRLASLYVDFVAEYTKIIPEEEQKNFIPKIISIYEDEILSNPDMLGELKANSRELESARDILRKAEEFCKEKNLSLKVEEVEELSRRILDYKL